MSLDPLIRIPLYTWVHLRAFRAFVVIVKIRHSLFFSLQLRVLRDRYEFEYQLDHPLLYGFGFFLSLIESSTISP